MPEEQSLSGLHGWRWSVTGKCPRLLGASAVASSVTDARRGRSGDGADRACEDGGLYAITLRPHGPLLRRAHDQHVAAANI